MFLLGSQKMGAMAGPRQLLSEITLSLFDGDKIGILGPNGAGKSTLMRLLLGVNQPDNGSVSRTRGVRIATLSQQDNFEASQTVKQTLLGGRDEYQWESSASLREISQGLLSDIPAETKVGELSGGQLRRLALACTLGADAQVLGLDEPTNHLDLEAVHWLAQYLKCRFSRGVGALLVVTHDRWFLDEVCNTIWEVVPGIDPGGDKPQIPGRVEVYEGSYAAYILARAERARMAAVAEEKRQNLLRKELAWLRRGAPARTSKPRFRIAAAEELIADTPAPRDGVELVKLATARIGKRVIEMENVDFSYGEKSVISNLTWRLSPGERVGIIGVNGAGKTTLFKLLQGSLSPDRGQILRGKTVQIGYLSQTPQLLEENSELRVVELVSRIKERITVGKGELTAAQLVEKLGFTKERAWTPVVELSGGEKRRLELVCQLLKEPNVLLLDEPTNDLDTDTLAQLEDLLDLFPGTLVIISHDRYLLQRATDHQMALMASGELWDLPGGVEQYLEIREIAKNERAMGKKEATGNLSDMRHSETKKSGGSQAYERNKQLKSLEKRLSKVQNQISELEKQLLDLATANDKEGLERLQTVHKQHEDLLSQAEELENQWFEIAEE